MLKAERTALNLLQRMSGIATETSKFVEALEHIPQRLWIQEKLAPWYQISG